MLQAIRIQSAALLLATAISLCAQNGQVAGPVVGYVFDASAGSLRPILGIPGASTLGSPLRLGYMLTSAVVAPRQDSAFGVAADGSLHFFLLNAGAATEAGCTACPASAAAAIVYSPSGTAAALYASGRVQVLTGLPSAPVAGTALAVASVAVPSGVRAAASARSTPPPMALSDDGLYLLAGEGGSIDLFSASGGPVRLMETASRPMVAFAPGGHDAAVVDGRAGVVLIHDVGGAATQQPLAPAAAPTLRPSGLAFSADGTQVLVATAANGTVVSIGTASGTSATISCSCAPTGLASMGSVLRLNDLAGGPIWLYDNTGAQPRVVFVPALVPAQ